MRVLGRAVLVTLGAGVLVVVAGNSNSVTRYTASYSASLPVAAPATSAKAISARWRAEPRPREHPFGETAAGLILPVRDFRITSFFRNTDPVHTGGVHSGVDFAAPEGAKIVSICPGKVVASGWMGAAGNAAIVRTENGDQVLYAHMSVAHVVKGDVVAAGDRIGRIGSTGNSTGPHLHLQVNAKKGKLADPVAFLGLQHTDIKRYGRS